MVMRAFDAIRAAAIALFRNWGVIAVLLLVYVGLLAAVYTFFAIREASLFQVGLTLALPVASAVLFFLLLALSVSYTKRDSTTGSVVRCGLRDFWKLALMTVPLILFGWLVVYLFGQIEIDAAAEAVQATRPRQPAQGAQAAADWRVIALSSLECLVLCAVLPLVAAQLWIATAREGLLGALKGAGRALLRAFAPAAVLTYATGALVFGVIPYFLIFTRTPSESAWLDLGLLGARLGFAALLTLFGWVITIGALGEVSDAHSI